MLGRKGTIGSVHYAASDYWPHDTTLWSKHLNGNNPRFVYYYLQTLNLRRFDTGNSNPTLNRNHIHDLQVFIPPRSTQDHIAGILSAYDDLVENNNSRMALLEEAARQLYQEWFVRIHFPGHEHTPMVDGAPEGWAPGTLGTLSVEARDSVDPASVEPGTPYIGLEHMPRRSTSLGAWGSARDVTSSKHRFRQGDVLFGKIRPYFHKVGLAPVDGVASSDAIVIRPRDDAFRALILCTASSDRFVAATAQGMKEGSKMPRADWGQMRHYPVPLPPEGLLATFSSLIDPITAQLRTLIFSNQRLRIARDLLLPRLMSGQITV